jgi:hypothetical protein
MKEGDAENSVIAPQEFLATHFATKPLEVPPKGDPYPWRVWVCWMSKESKQIIVKL